MAVGQAATWHLYNTDPGNSLRLTTVPPMSPLQLLAAAAVIAAAIVFKTTSSYSILAGCVGGSPMAWHATNLFRLALHHRCYVRCQQP